MNKLTVSAPGKLLLMGDHAVVYDRPCLVAAIDKRIYVTVEKTTDGRLAVDAPDIGLKGYTKDLSELMSGSVPKQAEYIEQLIYDVQKSHKLSGLKITTSAPELDSRFGFGTSAATLAAVIAGVNAIFQLGMTQKQQFDIAYASILNLKGVGSGFDLAASLYGSVLYFVTGGKTIEPIKTNLSKLLVAYSGYKGDTPTIVKDLAKRREENAEKIDKVFDSIARLTDEGRVFLESNNPSEFGRLANQQQQNLQVLGVSTKELDEICSLARSSGAYGAKLSGAGGGDIAIVFAAEDAQPKIKSVLSEAGYATMDIMISHEGVRVEQS